MPFSLYCLHFLTVLGGILFSSSRNVDDLHIAPLSAVLPSRCWISCVALIPAVNVKANQPFFSSFNWLRLVWLFVWFEMNSHFGQVHWHCQRKGKHHFAFVQEFFIFKRGDIIFPVETFTESKIKFSHLCTSSRTVSLTNVFSDWALMIATNTPLLPAGHLFLWIYFLRFDIGLRS